MQPKLDQIVSAEGKLDDVRDVKIGMADGNAFAFVADGANGMRVLQILSPGDSPNAYHFSPRPMPKLIATIATYRTAGPTLGFARGVDRGATEPESPVIKLIRNRWAVFVWCALDKASR